jgi:hypothetical protein
MTNETEHGSGTTLENQRIVDARMEYEQLSISIRTLVQLWWIDVSAFFTVNTLLATAFGFSFATGAQSPNATFLNMIHLLIPVTGVFFSLAAIYVAIALTGLMRLTNKRGRELEEVLFARMFGDLQSYCEKPPVVTVMASLLFLAMWVAAMWR